jgi:hydroxymethylglutaryl-CoA synthase
LQAGFYFKLFGFQFNGVSEGKYLVGMGLKEMGFCDDNEDVSSLALTVTSALLQNYNVSIMIFH